MTVPLISNHTIKARSSSTRAIPVTACISCTAVFYAGPLLADVVSFAVSVETFDRIFGALCDAFSCFFFRFDIISVAYAFPAFV